MATCGFICNLLCFRNCQKDGSVHGFKYPLTSQMMEKMGPAWVTKALRAAGTIPENVEVTSIDIKIPSTLGLLSELRFVTLTYSAGGESCPKVVVAKFAPPDLKTRGTTDLFELCRTEFKFYTGALAAELSKIGIRTPRCHYADMNFKTNNLCILLEQVDATFRNQLDEPATLEEAQLVMSLLAKLHGRFAGPTKSNEPMVQFINKYDGKVFQIVGNETGKHMKKVDEYKQGGEGWTYVLPRDFVSIFPDLKNESFNMLKYATANPETLGVTHGDTRLDNFFFFNEDAEKGGAPAAGVLDFQIMVRADCSMDVAYFLGSSCTPEFQGQHEQALLDQYFTELAAAGGPSILPGSEDRSSWEESYDLGLNSIMCKMIIGCGGIDPNAPRVVPAMDQLASGCAAMYTRRNAGTAYKKWRAHELIAQKRYPNLMADMGSTPVTIEIVPAPMPVNASKTPLAPVPLAPAAQPTAPDPVLSAQTTSFLYV